jgi:hypothetical protein
MLSAVGKRCRMTFRLRVLKKQRRRAKFIARRRGSFRVFEANAN